MKVAIIEDEKPAVEKLTRYLHQYDSSIQISATLASISESVDWIREHQTEVDLLFMDIQLTDGLSFEIFNEVEVNCPIIFTTAYDEYAIDAFRVNSIDYLLKPITFTALSQALKKRETLRDQFSGHTNLNTTIKQIAKPQYKERFLVKMGQHIHSIPTDEIALFYAEGRTVFLLTTSNRKFIIDYKLEDLEKLLNPKYFYRVNRSFITHIQAIKDILVYSNSRLKVSPTLSIDREIIVSRDKVNDFKAWLGGMSA